MVLAHVRADVYHRPASAEFTAEQPGRAKTARLNPLIQSGSNFQ